MPGEFLDFLAIYPYLLPKAIVVFHDVNLNFIRTKMDSSIKNIRNNSLCIATKALFCIIGGKKFFGLANGTNSKLFNIAAVQIDERTKSSIQSVFFGTQFTWAYSLDNDMLDEYRKIYSKYYDLDCLSLFDSAVKYNAVSLGICNSLYV